MLMQPRFDGHRTENLPLELLMGRRRLARELPRSKVCFLVADQHHLETRNLDPALGENANHRMKLLAREDHGRREQFDLRSVLEERHSLRP